MSQLTTNTHDLGIALFIVLIPVLLGGAIWFTLLQIAVMHRICVYCMSVHALGIVAAVLMFFMARSPGVSIHLGALRNAYLSLAVIGASAVAVLVAVQLAIRPKTYRVLVSGTLKALGDPATHNYALADGPASTARISRRCFARDVTFHGGKVVVSSQRWPQMGSNDPEIVYLFFYDHTCTACRALHRTIREALKHRPDIAVLCVPVPGEPTCNPHVTCRDPKRRNACAYARLMLRVWITAPERIADLDMFVFEGERPPELRDAVACASSLIGGNVFDPTVSDPDVDPWLREGIELIESLQLEQKPALLMRNGTFVGQASGVPELLSIFQIDASSGATIQPHTPALA